MRQVVSALRRGLVLLGLAVLAWPMAHPSRAQQCHLHELIELPLTMDGRRAIISAKVNGHDARFIADTGSYFSSVSLSNAKVMELRLGDWPYPIVGLGSTGLVSDQLGVAKTFEIDKHQLHDIEFLVGGSELGVGVDGVLGQNLFQAGDVDLDLSSGSIRLFQPRGCGQTALAYWVKPGGGYSSLDIWLTTLQNPIIRFYVYVNGVRLAAMLDSGANVTVITRDAALKAGIRSTDAGVVEAGRGAGFSQKTASSWIVPVADFAIADEEIKNTHIAMMDSDLGETDVIVGMDFLLSHHVFVASSQNKLYFSYVGGQVFTSMAPVAKLQKVALPEAEPKDAAGFARRGEAFLSRQQYDLAIADLTRSIQMDGAQADVYYALGRANAFAGHQDAARADLDQALKLRPDDVRMLLLRAQMRQASNPAGADADLQAADKLMSPGDHGRLELGGIYAGRNDHARALAQYDLWVASHPDDADLPAGLNDRCWQRALMNQDLDKARADCDRAIRMQPTEANFWDSRGMLDLRQGQPDKAVQDYDQALKLNPKLAFSLYGRSLAKGRLGQAQDAAADKAAALAVDPKIEQKAKDEGVAG